MNALSMAKDIGLEVNVNTSETVTSGGYRNTISVEMDIEGLLNANKVYSNVIDLS
jgi:hypothetical protein